ncbi:hypothetical protein LCGC14_1830040 [marine sediment metagenome]|uniref:Uncharacterized protein n=1 Tax=marine sediment metagenome TaxID=412755 RepID=A0A0F9GGM6_9ZZZZ
MSDQTLETIQALIAEGFQPPFHVATVNQGGMIFERYDVVGIERSPTEHSHQIKAAELSDHMADLFTGEPVVHQLWTDSRGAGRYVRDGKFVGAEWPTPNPN